MNFTTRTSEQLIRIAKLVSGTRGSDLNRDWTVNLASSNLFNSAPAIDFDSIHSKWAKSSLLWNDGHYIDAVKLRTATLEELYKHALDEFETYSPPFMEMPWTTNIGHLGLLGIFVFGQKLGLVAPQRRIIFANTASCNYELELHFAEEFRVVRNQGSASWTSLSHFWLLSEKIQMVKCLDGFKDIYALWEDVFNRSQRKIPTFQLQESYRQYILSRLAEMGFVNENFVTFHIRKESRLGDTRGSSIEKYEPSIKYLLSLGIQIILIGNSTGKLDDSIESSSLFFDFRDIPYQEFHAFALAECLFFVGTCSGPASIPTIFGRPILMTNATAIARNMLTCHPKSIYIPKRIYRNGIELSFSQIISSPYGYMEGNPRSLAKDGVFFDENSSNCILDSVKEMLRNLEIPTNLVHHSELSQLAHELQNTFETIGKGRVSEAFLRLQNSHYLS